MLSSEELSAWYERLNLSPETRSVIDQVRSSDPARRVGGGQRERGRALPEQKDESQHPVRKPPG
jgi:putative transposase